jgi:hypothetical protein
MDALQGCHFVDDDKLKNSACEELRCFSKRCLCDWHAASHTNMEKCVDNEGEFVEK